MVRTNRNNTGAAGASSREPRYEDYVESVDAAVATVSWQCGLTASEAEDLRSETWLKLLRTQGLALRRFRGQSPLHTYLTAVVRNVLRDLRNRDWGKWRPSAVARRLGPMGIAIDRLLNRDRVPLEHIENLVRSSGTKAEGYSVSEIIAALPARSLRRFLGGEVLDTMPSRDRSPFDVACWNERHEERLRIRRALTRALAGLTRSERGLVVSRYFHGRRIADWARSHGENDKRLYRQLADILRKLRICLEGDGIRGTDARHAIADGLYHLDVQPIPIRKQRILAVRRVRSSMHNTTVT